MNFFALLAEVGQWDGFKLFQENCRLHMTCWMIFIAYMISIWSMSVYLHVQYRDTSQYTPCIFVTVGFVLFALTEIFL